MYLLLFVFWIILNQKINTEIILFGIGITFLIALFIKVLFDYDFKKDIKILIKVPLFIGYLFVLLIEIIKASINMIGIILNKNRKVEPTIVEFHSGLKTKIGNFILANSITLTPGTITINVDGDHFEVHCLDRSMLDTSLDSTFIKNIRRMEGTKWLKPS